MSSSTQIGDPSSLSTAGTGATELAGHVKTAGHLPVDETHSASKDFSGANWDGGLGSALSSLAEKWASQAAALVTTCNALGDQCTTTANNYDAVQTQNTRTMTAQGSQNPFG